MKCITRFVLPALVASIGALLVPHDGLAQNDPLIGIWKVNLAKSKHVSGNVITYRIIQASGKGLIQAFSGQSAKGAYLIVQTIVCDGKQHPALAALPEGGGVGSNTCTRPDPYTREYVNFDNENKGTPGTMVVSRDGRTMTVTFNDGGVGVYDRVDPATNAKK